MLKVRLTGCTDCSSIDHLLSQIDEVLTHYARNAINNDKYELGKYIPTLKMEKLIRYKTILLKRRLNPEYLWRVPNSQIISRVTALLN